MISLELASVILGRDIKYIKENEFLKSVFFYTEDSSFLGEYNIYEVANKVKEWAFSNGYSIYATQYKIDKGEWCLYIYDGCSDVYDTNNTFKQEPEAIFKGGQWILDNKDKQCN